VDQPKRSPSSELRFQANLVNLGRLFGRIGVLLTALVFIWAGVEFTRFAWNRSSELGDLPLWLIHIAWPLAGVSWIIFLGEQMFDDIKIVAGKMS
jgi:TRAP-type transport system small permease protein